MKTILIVDDEPSVRFMIKEMIEPVGYEVIEAGDGAEAYNICNNNALDLIVSDIVMPEKNGIDLIIQLKKEFPSIPVIAISGGGGVAGHYDYLEIAKLVGANNILKKPFSAKEICAHIENALL